jgi:hypothetical protein
MTTWFSAGLWALALVATLLGCGVCQADDTRPGLDLDGASELQVRSVDVRASLAFVRLSYHLKNTGTTDVTAPLSFVLPMLSSQSTATGWTVPAVELENFLAALIRVDGTAIAATVEQRAFLDGTEITARLTASSIPLSPRASATMQAIRALPENERQQLIDDGLLLEHRFDNGFGSHADFIPQWITSTRLSWSLTVRPHASTVIEVTHGLMALHNEPALIGNPRTIPQTLKSAQTRYCFTQGFASAAAREFRVAALQGWGSLHQTRELLFTLNMLGGTRRSLEKGDLRVTVDLPKSQARLAACARFLRIAPRTYALRHQRGSLLAEIPVLLHVPKGLE